MDRMKTSEIISRLKADGWYLARQRGSHRQFKHPTKRGTVTINGKMSETQSQFMIKQHQQTGGMALISAENAST